MTREQRRLRDPRELTALAHPVRMGIIEWLTINGPMTATELGERLGQSPANCSWHLRKLAEHGFVEEAEGEGEGGRKRPWRVPTVGFTVSEEDLGAEGRQAAQLLESLWIQRALDRYHESRVAFADDPVWTPAMGSVEDVAWLTAEELASINESIRTVISTHHERMRDADARPDGARLCEFVSWGVPVDFTETGDPR